MQRRQEPGRVASRKEEKERKEKKNRFDNRSLPIYVVVLLIVACQRPPAPIEGIYVSFGGTDTPILEEELTGTDAERQ